FSPSTLPFKRLRAYDAVRESGALYVRDTTLHELPVGGSVGAGDDPFFGDFTVELRPGQRVRIPSVGPGARILKMHSYPEVDAQPTHDGADNWFLQANNNQKTRIVMELAIG